MGFCACERGKKEERVFKVGVSVARERKKKVRLRALLERRFAHCAARAFAAPYTLAGAREGPARRPPWSAGTRAGRPAAVAGRCLLAAELLLKQERSNLLS